jgi:PAS domain S-box-containing protein
MLEIPSPNIFQAIVDRIETGVFALDLDRKISYWNHGAEKITGFLSQDVLGRPIEARLGAWEEKSASTADGNGRGA